MSMGSSIAEEEEKTETIFVAEEYISSEEPPMDEWPSLVLNLPETNTKKILLEDGLYHPGSGNICTKYVPLSDSAMLQHVFNNYPAITDPGIKEALFRPEHPVIYPDDGQELYLALCREIGIAPVKTFYKCLFEDIIDLKYYGVDPKGIRAMASALKYNNRVKTFNLTDNFLNDDACYHLGDMLSMNSSLEELNLSGCRIQSSGVRRLLAGLSSNKSLNILNLDKNQLGDDGVELIANSVFKGIPIQNIYLSYNTIGGRGANALAEAFETHNKFINIDFSWNNLFVPGPTYSLLSILGENNNLREVDLSWNSLSGQRIGQAIKNVLKAKNLQYLNCSNNRLSDDAITEVISGLDKAKKLVTLDLSYNPMSPSDALQIIMKMSTPTVKVQKILLDNIYISNEFLEVLEQVKNMKSRKNFSITYGGVLTSFKSLGPDIREVLLNRVETLTMKSKKRSVNIALLVLQLEKENRLILTSQEFYAKICNAGASLDNRLVDEIVNVFAGPRGGKETYIDIALLADYIRRKWPERKLPPSHSSTNIRSG